MRCAWARGPLMEAYHDAEWGVPRHDDRDLFEMLVLEGAQAGLSWETVLRKRDGYRAAFDGFDPERVARFDAARIDALAADPRIIRHRGKIASAVGNAAAFLAVRAEFGSFAAHLWGFVDGRPVVADRPPGVPPPARTPLSDRVSTDLRRRGFTFVGSTIVQAFLQATGVVDDHDRACFRAGPAGDRAPACAPSR
jgi:DNA-3-methyladenine glycosylase I